MSMLHVLHIRSCCIALATLAIIRDQLAPRSAIHRLTGAQSPAIEGQHDQALAC